MLDTARRSPFLALLFAFALAGAILFARAALAAPTAGSGVSGTSPVTVTLSEGASILLQCRNQIVTVRGMDPNDVHDAGLRDVAVDFITNPDAVPITLTGPQTKLGLMNFDGGSVDCNRAPNR